MTEKYRHKKQFGQHFLHDEHIASQIVEKFLEKRSTDAVLEVGPGEGVLTKYLQASAGKYLFISEIDRDIVALIHERFHPEPGHLLEGDFLQQNLSTLFPKGVCIIGNFPYNISTQIVFSILEHRQVVPMMTGMFQKEVAERIAAKHGNKVYGITSVLTQAFYDVEYLFTVSEGVFTPPPKVKSAVIRLVRKEPPPGVDYKTLLQLVKMAFNQRRKMLRNALQQLMPQWPDTIQPFLTKRAEELSVQDFIGLAAEIKTKTGN